MVTKTNDRQEFIKRLDNATPDTIDLVLKFMVLSVLDHGFDEAVEAATPPGEKIPPLSVLRKLVDEWAEREGL